MSKIQIENGIAFYLGENIQTKKHVHHALEFVVGLESTFDLEIDKQKLSNISMAVIPPNIIHKFTGTLGKHLFVYIDPELFFVEKVMSQLNLGKDNFWYSDKPCSLTQYSEQLFSLDVLLNVFPFELPNEEKSRIADRRITQLIDFIKDNLEDTDLSLTYLASSIFLSESRLSHLFKLQIGLSISRYILWCRIQKAISLIIETKNITQSAHSAGFSDSAHFTRVFVEMFGIAPSKVLKKIA